MASLLHTEALRRAAAIVGGVEVLALQWDVRSELLEKYIRGESPVPPELFLKASEIITAAAVRDAAKSNSEIVSKQ